ncbi:hypothetical protein CJ030_MR7G017864 [Morella rubra]|uniref:Uncharacterized protein n=1 Tax=Morella rubra TaxID=262757 RepID=A0A6A1UZ74_9ROSI|nr:hypothetical protein CJ030_MR7G017864 [Morella rubra]
MGRPSRYDLDLREFKKVRWYVLNNCSEIEHYHNAHKDELRRRRVNDVDRKHEEDGLKNEEVVRRRVRMMTVQTWEMTGDMRLECGETMANRAKRQRAVAPCPSSPPPVFNDVAATTSCRWRSQLVPVMPAPTPSTPASGDFETRASSQPTLAPSLGGMTHSSTGSTSNSGRRGRTCGLALDKVRATRLDKLSVSIPDNCAADVGENSAKLSTQIGLLVRGTIPMATSSWNEDDFNLDYNLEEDLQTVNMIMAKSYRQFKGRLHEHYKKKGGGNKEVAIRHPIQTWMKILGRNCVTCLLIQNMRKGLTIFHTAGTRTFARYRKVLETSPSVTSEIGLAELYAASHKRKNGDWLSDVAKDNHLYEFLYSGIVPTIAVILLDLQRLSLEKMRELQEQAISDGRSYNDIDILHQVLGPKPGYVRGLGRAVKPPRSSGSHPLV